MNIFGRKGTGQPSDPESAFTAPGNVPAPDAPLNIDSENFILPVPYQAGIHVEESTDYEKTYTIDQTTSIQGEHPPLNLDLLLRYWNSIPQVDTAVEFTANFIVGSELIFNCDDKKAKEVITEWCINTDFHERYKSAVIMMLVTGLGLLYKVVGKEDGKKRMLGVEDFDISTIERINRDKYGNAKTIVQRLPNSGLHNLSVSGDHTRGVDRDMNRPQNAPRPNHDDDRLPDDEERPDEDGRGKTRNINKRHFVRLVVRPNFRNYWGRSMFASLAHVPSTRGRIMPPHGDRLLGEIDAIIGSVENFAHPLTFISTEGMDDKIKKEFKEKLARRKPGEMFIANQIPQIYQMQIASTAQYAPFIDYFEELTDHGVGMPLDILKGDFTSRASSETTNSMFMLKITDYQASLARMIVNDIFIPVLHERGFKEINTMNFSISFKSERPREYTPEQVAQRVELGIWTIEEARRYDKNQGQDLFDDDAIKKQEKEQHDMEQDRMKADIDASKAAAAAPMTQPGKGGAPVKPAPKPGMHAGARPKFPSDEKKRPPQTPKSASQHR